ncbi:MAG: saccharopine dehydrogenase NADP-binding domain-containing protein [Thermoanaerobaculia bacterium]|nr:saccharopine dehydrogenase NADP-binding domain-containing protein [Thermoanaerobaculia bacterium]
MKKIAVLGTGLVGSLIARDLAGDSRFEILAVDRSETALAALSGYPRLSTLRADLASPSEVAKIIEPVDAVVGAVPGFLGASVLRTVIECHKPVADIAFSKEDPFLLDGLAREKGVPAVVDCGVSPGLSNLAAGRAAADFDETESIRIFVGGLPFPRVWPYEYRIVFSATDVVEEYVRPARTIRNGRIVILPALSEVELIDIPEIGTLEAFLTDGLRTLLATVPARQLEEKTLRYPGHAEKMRMLRDTGFFSEDRIRVGGASVSPREVTERLLFESWKRPAGEEEFVALRVVCTGSQDGVRLKRTFGLFDRTDRETGETSMARTTGFPPAVIVGLLTAGSHIEPGIHPLEDLGKDPELYDAITSGLREKGLSFTETVEEIPGE